MKTDQLKPFEVVIKHSSVEDLYRRLDAVRYPDEDTNLLKDRDIHLATMHHWIDYWRNQYDIHSIEKKFNRYDLYKTEQEGIDLVFTHVPSKQTKNPPLLLLHGWPDTPLSYFDMIELLDSHYELIIPTLPGFGLPGPAKGLNSEKASTILLELMNDLGFEKYYIHGEDFGAAIARQMALDSPETVKAIHVTMLSHANAFDPDDINQDDPYEVSSLKASQRYINELSGYSTIQSTKPQDIAYSMSDSPAGLLAWISSQFVAWSSPDKKIKNDYLIDTVMVYWLYNTLPSSARYYQLSTDTWLGETKNNSVPTAVTVMPNDIGLPIKRIAKKTDNIIRWTYAEKGGHFAACDSPKFLTKEIILLKSFFSE